MTNVLTTLAISWTALLCLALLVGMVLHLEGKRNLSGPIAAGTWRTWSFAYAFVHVCVFALAYTVARHGLIALHAPFYAGTAVGLAMIADSFFSHAIAARLGLTRAH
jgi:hypothetical protein